MGPSRDTAAGQATGPAVAAAGIVLLTLSSAQFLMTLDSSVMNVSIATVAKDVGTTVTGIQTAITFYTLVMASLMITGGKLGQILGRKRAFAIGCVIYGCGSLITALAPNLTVLLLGWSVLEGVGAALIMPAIVALVALNFAQAERPRAYGLVASAGAIAVAAGPLIGGLFTTYLSWRWVFVGEVLMVPPEQGARLDLVGTVLSALGLGLVVYGILRSGTWGFIQPKADAPRWLGLSPVIWLVLCGGVVLRLFLWWETHRLARGDAALIDPAMLRNRTLRGGLTSFFFQYFLQAGLFFAVPLFLSVALGLSAVATGVRLLPLSITLLLAAAGIPRVFPHASPRRVVRIGFLALFAGIVILVAALDSGAGPEIVTWPMLLAGFGVGAGLAARQRDRLIGTRRAKRRSRRDPEHGDQPRRLDRHRTGRRRAHLSADHHVPRQRPEQPRHSQGPRLTGSGGAGRRHPVSVRQGPEGRPRQGRRAPQDRLRDHRRERKRPHQRAAHITVAAWRRRTDRTVLQPKDPD
ncbi:MAG: MFS transporter [Streptosporangiaceae bacterium]